MMMPRARGSRGRPVSEEITMIPGVEELLGSEDPLLEPIDPEKTVGSKVLDIDMCEGEWVALSFTTG